MDEIEIGDIGAVRELAVLDNTPPGDQSLSQMVGAPEVATSVSPNMTAKMNMGGMKLG